MKETYLDLHTHTVQSDGAYSPLVLCGLAREAKINILAITDHNYTEDLTELRSAWPELRIIQGAEISCLYTDSQGTTRELHVVALGVDRENPKLKAVLAKNQPDRKPYIDAILQRLRHCGIDLGTYEDLCRRNPGKRHIGRMDMAKQMADEGYVASVEEAFDVYVGSHGECKAYVPNPLQYVSVEEAVEAIVDAGGAAVLAHLYYYQLDEAQSRQLLKRFKELAGTNGAMEVFYSRYSQQQRMALKALADEYGLMYSAASDFHGQSENDTLCNGFAAADCLPLLNFLGIE